MPKQTEVRVSYSVGLKLNIGNYSSADVHFSEAETFSVEDLDSDQIATFSDERVEALREKLDARLHAAAEEITAK